MKKKYLLKLLTTSLLAVFLFNFSGTGLTRAATSDTSIVIQPPRIEVVASPEQKLARTFSVINRSNFTVKLKLVVKDYKQSFEDGKLEFYDAETEQASLWLIPQYLEIGLKPLETKDVSFVPKDFSAGGHYGAILLQSAGSATNLNTNNFGELVLLTVTSPDSAATATAKAVNFWTGAIQQGNPVDFNFKLQNTGNTHFNANANLVLKNWAGKEIDNYNIGQLTIYPGTTRLFTWRWNGTPRIGVFRAEVMLSNPPPNQNSKIVDSTWFIIFPWPIALLVLFAGLITFALVKYRKYIFKKTSKWVDVAQKKNLKIREKFIQ